MPGRRWFPTACKNFKHRPTSSTVQEASRSVDTPAMPVNESDCKRGRTEAKPEKARPTEVHEAVATSIAEAI